MRGAILRTDPMFHPMMPPFCKSDDSGALTGNTEGTACYEDEMLTPGLDGEALEKKKTFLGAGTNGG